MIHDEAGLRHILRTSPVLRPLLQGWLHIGLPEAWLSGSGMAQLYWNERFGLPPDHGLADIDLIYFDATDRSMRREARHATRVRRRFDAVPLWIDVKNQARVHLWYERRFGHPIEPYRSIHHALSTFPTTASIAIRPSDDGIDMLAPFGLSDILSGTVRANKVQISQGLYEAKINRWKQYWPHVRFLPWDHDGAASATE